MSKRLNSESVLLKFLCPALYRNTDPIEHHVSALASDLSMELRYDTNASWTFPILEKHLQNVNDSHVNVFVNEWNIIYSVM